MTEENKSVKKFPNLLPRLRFSGFVEDWKVKKLGDICKMQAGKFVSASQILKETDNKLYPCYGANGLRGFTYSYNYEGEYSLIGRQGALCGNITRACDKFYATEHAVVVTPKDKIHSIWLFYLLSYLNLNQYATGMAQPGLSVQNLLEVESIITDSIEEQEKIASLLSLIDNRIQTQKKIIEDTVLMKNSISKKIFSRKLNLADENGNNFPKWEEKTLAEVLSEPIQKPERNSNEIELLTVRLYCKGVENTGNYPAITKNGRPYYRRFTNEILIGRQNFHNGGIGIVQEKNNGKICSNAISSYNVISDDLQFIYYNIARPEYYTKVDNLIGGTGQKEISKTDFLKLKIYLPVLEEQIKIANFLKKLEDKIILESELLIQYENQKRYLLQNLFI